MKYRNKKDYVEIKVKNYIIQATEKFILKNGTEPKSLWTENQVNFDENKEEEIKKRKLKEKKSNPIQKQRSLKNLKLMWGVRAVNNDQFLKLIKDIFVKKVNILLPNRNIS